MANLTIDYNDTQKVAESLELALRTTKPDKPMTKKEIIEGRVMAIKTILDRLRHQLLFREPSKN